MTSLFASFLSKIGPRAVRTKASLNVGAALELRKRLFGVDTEEEITQEQLEVLLQAVEAEAAVESSLPSKTAPVASVAARKQLADFLRQVNLRHQTSNQNPFSSSSPSSSWSAVHAPFTQHQQSNQTPFSSNTTTTTTPQSTVDPTTVDLRVPVNTRDATNMVHLAQ